MCSNQTVIYTTFSSLPADARILWSKSGDEGGHGLLAHWLDVAAVAETLLEMEPAATRQWAEEAFGLTAEQVVRWLAALAGLHDFGKAIPGFQAKWTEGRAADESAGLGFPFDACRVDQHGLATACLLQKALVQRQVADRSWIRHVVQAVSAHHGLPFQSSEIENGNPDCEPRAWGKARQTLLEAYWQTLAPQGRPGKEELSLSAVNWLAGLTSAADWIASNQEWFALGERGYDDLRDYYADARRLAAIALQDIGWMPWQALLEQGTGETDSLLARIVGNHALKARPLQDAGDRLLRDVQGPALLLVEAPMGEGKTELAFLAHLRMQAANGHRGLYVALPTQATSNALFKRALTFLKGFVQGHADVQLVHGGAAMNEAVQHLRGINHNSDESLSASAWFAQRRRPLLSPYGVGTVDQALLAVLNVTHHFVRWWGLGNRVVVLDEVHAYDTYTSGLIEMLLRWLKSLGCSVVLMSATLPRARRDVLIDAWGLQTTSVPDLAYPRILLVDDRGARGETFAARPLPPIHLHGLAESLDALADKSVELSAQGGCGAVIVNTVDRAQKLYSMLRERLGEEVQLQLFHARFPMDERADLETRVLRTFGFGGDVERPARALLIATQVAEQSLDIDFDFMLSDLAPADLLLQRAGRLHRHQRVRPAAHAVARLFVAGLQPERLPELKETGWGFVYDAYILGRTWAFFGQEAVLNLPEDIDRLVQTVYSNDSLPDTLEEKGRESIEGEFYGEYRASVKLEQQFAANIVINLADEPQSAYAGKPPKYEEGEGLGLENKTRLGRESITLIPFDVDDKDIMLDKLLDDVHAKKLYDHQIKVSKLAVVRHFKAVGLPVAFQESALLRHAYPLPLQQGRYKKDGLDLRLDKVLGLVYESTNSAQRQQEQG
jgi:CRISPR-associated endonuclease/helicase Cas3